jgi:hypothetical protein
MIADTTKEKLVIYRISADGTEEELCEHEIDPTKTIGDTLFEMSLEQRTPYEAARFMLNMRDVKGNERRRLRAIVDKEACKQCIRDNNGVCIRGYSEEWVEKILD